MHDAQNPRELALLVLDEIYERGAYANLALNKALRGNGLSSLDRKLCTELVYGTVKTTGTLDWYLCRVINRPFRKMAPRLRTILRMGAYQILYLERIPDSAAVNECANLARYYVNENSVKLVNGVLRQLSRTKATWQFPQKEEDATLRLALTYYHPEWLVRRWKFRFGLPEAEAMCAYDNAVPSLCLRVNTLFISRKTLLERLQADGCEVEPSKWSPDGIVCRHLPSLETLMKEWGRFLYIQDESSMLDADVLAPKPGDLVLDFVLPQAARQPIWRKRWKTRGKSLPWISMTIVLPLLKKMRLVLGSRISVPCFMMEQSPFLVLKIGLTRFLSMRLVRGSVSLTVGQKRAGPKGTDPQSVPTPPEKDPCPGRGLCEARRQAPIQYLYLGTG